MSRSPLEIRRCDRCGHEATLKTGEPALGWGVIHAAAFGSKRVIGHSEGVLDDLCAACTEEVFAWYAAPREPQEQPQAARSAPAVKIPPFTPGDRQRAIEAVDNVLREQVFETIAAYHEEPTALIGGETLPASIAGTASRAEQIVDELASKLRPAKKGRGK